MRLNLIIFIFVTCFFSGCASSGPFRTVSTRNNLNRLEIGMSKNEIVNIMGQPYQREVFLGDDGEPIEVLLYQTKFVGMAVSPSDRELTPIVLKNKELIGWGRNFYDTTKRYHIKQDIEIK